MLRLRDREPEDHSDLTEDLLSLLEGGLDRGHVTTGSGEPCSKSARLSAEITWPLTRAEAIDEAKQRVHLCQVVQGESGLTRLLEPAFDVLVSRAAQLGGHSDRLLGVCHDLLLVAAAAHRE